MFINMVMIEALPRGFKRWKRNRPGKRAEPVNPPGCLSGEPECPLFPVRFSPHCLSINNPVSRRSTSSPCTKPRKKCGRSLQYSLSFPATRSPTRFPTFRGLRLCRGPCYFWDIPTVSGICRRDYSPRGNRGLLCQPY